jgi:hypothetical protein
MAASLTVEDLKRLSLRAVVALCVRYASRLRPGFDLPGNTPDRGKEMAAVDAAIQMARTFAAGKPIPSNAEHVVSAAMKAGGDAPGLMGIYAQKAGIAAGVALTIHDGQSDLALNRAKYCLQSAGKAAIEIRADYERLGQLGLGSFPDLGDAIDVSDDGPLGPISEDNLA